MIPTIDKSPIIITETKKNKTEVSKVLVSKKDINIPISLVSSRFFNLVLSIEIFGLIILWKINQAIKREKIRIIAQTPSLKSQV